jgi:hypothetical protein
MRARKLLSQARRQRRPAAGSAPSASAGRAQSAPASARSSSVSSAPAARARRAGAARLRRAHRPAHRQREQPVAVNLVPGARPPGRGGRARPVRPSHRRAVHERERVRRLAPDGRGLAEQGRDRVVGKQARAREQGDREHAAERQGRRVDRRCAHLGPHGPGERPAAAPCVAHRADEAHRVDPPLCGRDARDRPQRRLGADCLTRRGRRDRRAPNGECDRVPGGRERRGGVGAHQVRARGDRRSARRAVDDLPAESLQQARRFDVRRGEPAHVALGEFHSAPGVRAPDQGRAAQPRHRHSRREQRPRSARQRQRGHGRHPHEYVPPGPPGRRVPQRRPRECGPPGEHRGDERRQAAHSAQSGPAEEGGAHQQRRRDQEQRDLPRRPEPHRGAAGRGRDAARQFPQQIRPRDGECRQDRKRPGPRRQPNTGAQRGEQAHDQQQPAQGQRAHAARERAADRREVHGRVERAARVGERVQRGNVDDRGGHEQRREPPGEFGRPPGGVAAARPAAPRGGNPHECHRE